MGRRSRARAKQGTPDSQPLEAPTSDYADVEGNVLTLRGSLTPGARREYADALSGHGARTAATQEDSVERAFELLFERLAVRWTIAEVPIESQRELLGRLRVATPAERGWVRGALREHCAEWFPDVKTP